jgi:hypothetical protein
LNAPQPATSVPAAGPAAVSISWLHREPPLVRAAVTATGRASRALALSTEARVDAGPVSLRVAGRHAEGDLDRLVVLGDPDDLPWCAGAQYLGWEAGVLLPTERRPTVPTDILAAQARAMLAGAALVIVLPDALVGMPMPGRGVDGPTLRAWIGG